MGGGPGRSRKSRLIFGKTRLNNVRNPEDRTRHHGCGDHEENSEETGEKSVWNGGGLFAGEFEEIAGHRRVARQGEHDPQVPGPELRGQGFGRACRGPAEEPAGNRRGPVVQAFLRVDSGKGESRQGPEGGRANGRPDSARHRPGPRRGSHLPAPQGAAGRPESRDLPGVVQRDYPESDPDRHRDSGRHQLERRGRPAGAAPAGQDRRLPGQSSALGQGTPGHLGRTRADRGLAPDRGAGARNRSVPYRRVLAHCREAGRACPSRVRGAPGQVPGREHRDPRRVRSQPRRCRPRRRRFPCPVVRCLRSRPASSSRTPPAGSASPSSGP